MKNYKSRITVSIFANFFRGGSTILIGILLARFLGSSEYGSLVFLIATSMAIKQFLDLGTSSAFFTFISQEARSRRFIFQFLGFFFAKYALAILLIILVIPGVWKGHIWLGQSDYIVVIALITVSFQFDFWPIASHMLESKRETLKSQSIFIFTQLIHLAIIFALNYLDHLDLANYLISVSGLWFISGVIAFGLCTPIETHGESSKHSISLRDYFIFCLPIAPIIFISFMAEFFDRWILQSWGGANQQAYFSVASQIAAGSLLITASFIKIFWKEVAESWHLGRRDSALRIYRGTRQAIFYCGSFIAAAVIPWATSATSFIYGDVYIEASITLMLLMIYSIHQSLGQIDSAFLMASGNTKVGFKINFVLAPVGALISLILISNLNMLGLNLGSLGLAIKMMICQIISVNIIAYLIQREVAIKFDFFEQIKVPMAFIALSVIVKFLLVILLDEGKYIFIPGILCYFLLVIIILIFSPGLLFLPKDWLDKLKKYFLQERV